MQSERYPRILHVITGLGTGGAEHALASLITGTPEPERPIGVVSLTDHGRYGPEIEAAGVPVAALNMRAVGRRLAGVVRLARQIRRLKPDVVQSWMYHADLAALASLYLSGRRRRTRLIWGVRCSDMETARYSPALGFVIRLCARFSRAPDVVVANSHVGRDFHLSLRYRPRRFEVIHNGVDVDTYRPDAAARAETRRALGLPENTVVAAVVGRVDPMKDHETFLAAFSSTSGAHALLIGRDTERFAGLERVHCLGLREDVPRILAASDIVVSSSAFGEGFPNAIAEGMAAGLAPVATDVGDAAELIDDTGLVVPRRSADALASALQTLIDDPALRADLGARARERVMAHFSMENCAAAFRNLYASLERPPNATDGTRD